MRICNRCGNEVNESDIDGYAYECDTCDESLYTFETSEDGVPRAIIIPSERRANCQDS